MQLIKNHKDIQSTFSNILELCRFGLLSDALNLLNYIGSGAISAKPMLYASLLQACTKVHSFNHGLQIHSHVIKSGLETDRFVGNSLLALYFKLNPNFRETRKVFDVLHFKDVISWTSMISGYVRAGEPRNSIALFLEMLDFGVEPNAFTLSTVIKACAEIGDLKLGRSFHCVIFRTGLDSNHVVASGLIDMYGRNYESRDARQLFDELLEPDAVCATSVISALTRNDLFEEALGFFYSMQRNFGLAPDSFTFGTVLTACGNLGRLKQGKQVHAQVIAAGIRTNVIVESSLVDMYGKCRSLDRARQVFDRMTRKNSVSWCALLSGYCQEGDFDAVILLFRAMKEVDLYTFSTVLRACAGLSVVRHGKEVHCQYLRRGGWRDVIAESALVDLYAKCGCIDFAYRVFLRMHVRNSITWNSMICGFAQNGRGDEAIRVFNEMIDNIIKPDYITFIGVLFACSHTGLVDQARNFFTLMTEKYNIKPGIEHYTCMVDLLGRAGQLEEAEEMIVKADVFSDDSSLWATLLGACTTSTNSSVAERVAKKMMQLDPEYHLSYVLLANVYRSNGRWDEAVEIRNLMENRGVKKKMPGKSWIDIKGKLGLGFEERPIQQLE